MLDICKIFVKIPSTLVDGYSGSFCGAVIGKIDAMVFIVGLFIGIVFFIEAYPLFDDMYKANFLGVPKVSNSLGLKDGVFALFLIIAAVGMFWIAEWAEKKYPREEY